MLRPFWRYWDRSDTEINPRQFSGLAVWLDALDNTSVTLTGGAVSAMVNKGNTGAGNASQGSATNRPIVVNNVINGRKALHFFHDGVNFSRLDIADSTALDYTSSTMFVVGTRLVDNGLDNALLSKFISTGNQREFRLLVTSTDTLVMQGSTDGTATTNATAGGGFTVPLSTPFIVDGTYASGTNAQSVIWNNSSTFRGTATLATIFNGTAPVYVGARVGGEGFNGYIGEVLFFTRSLNSTERNVILRYLSAKWGIPVS